MSSVTLQQICTHMMQVADGITNAVADAMASQQSSATSVLVLVVQLVIRLSWLGACVALMMTTAFWRIGAMDSLVLEFCGMLSANSIGLVVSTCFRVYRVMMASHPDQVQRDSTSTQCKSSLLAVCPVSDATRISRGCSVPNSPLGKLDDVFSAVLRHHRCSIPHWGVAIHDIAKAPSDQNTIWRYEDG